MKTALEVVTADGYRKRIVDLLGGGRRMRFPPRRRRDRWIILHALARGFRAGETLDQTQVDARLRDWLDFIGTSVDADEAALRRALIDEGFLGRAPDGSRYWTSTDHEHRVTFEPDCATIDVESVLAEAARRADEKRRSHGA